MFYSEEFKARCKAIYPSCESLHKALEDGSEMVGRYLDDGYSNSLPLDTILNASSLEELQTQAKVEVIKNELYREWFNLYREQSTAVSEAVAQ